MNSFLFKCLHQESLRLIFIAETKEEEEKAQKMQLELLKGNAEPIKEAITLPVKGEK